MKLKVCGMKYQENVEEVLALQPDYLGFIFYAPSKRFMEESLNKEWVASIEGSEKVGVFVDEEMEVVKQRIQDYQLDLVQLHGKESPAYCEEIRKVGVKVVKAFSIGKEGFDFGLLESYQHRVDYFLFDTKGKHPGGNGITFNWDILKQYQLDTHFWLSGGIKLEHVDAIHAIQHPKLMAIDVNSGFETEPGRKQIDLLKTLTDRL
ncbi:MAG: phosphoribosylanthranilate isomerase [Bacteroidota bacterium]